MVATEDSALKTVLLGYNRSDDKAIPDFRTPWERKQPFYHCRLSNSTNRLADPKILVFSQNSSDDDFVRIDQSTSRLGFGNPEVCAEQRVLREG